MRKITHLHDKKLTEFKNRIQVTQNVEELLHTVKATKKNIYTIEPLLFILEKYYTIRNADPGTGRFSLFGFKKESKLDAIIYLYELISHKPYPGKISLRFFTEEEKTEVTKALNQGVLGRIINEFDFLLPQVFKRDKAIRDKATNEVVNRPRA